jgi:hypothetical protein
MMTTQLLDDCGEHPALGALLGEAGDIDANGGKRFVVVYDLCKGLGDASLASRMQSLCVFER